MNRYVSIWFCLAVFWLFIPKTSIGYAEPEKEQPVISEQLQKKMERVRLIRQQCKSGPLCNMSILTLSTNDHKQTGVMLLLAGVSLQR